MKFSKLNLKTSENVLRSIALTQMENYIPGITKSVTSTSVQYWPNAIPVSAPGKADLVQQYRNEISHKLCHVYLAGDYLNFTATEPAAQTGVWAAGEILKR